MTYETAVREMFMWMPDPEPLYEEAARSAGTDAALENLFLVEVGEWLSGTQWEAAIASNSGEARCKR